MRVGLASDHAGFYLKGDLAKLLTSAGHEVHDFGAMTFVPDDDYPDFVIPLAKSVALGEMDRGIAVCGSGVGACIAANKVKGARAALIHDLFSARQGVEDDDMNLLCLGQRVVDLPLAEGVIKEFLAARFSGLERHERRLRKIADFEGGNRPP